MREIGQMRITGGELGGRLFAVPGREVRPTQDRVREAVFSSLGAHIVDARALDLFAGSGSYGLEAWSRGAGEVCWVEHSGEVLKLLRRNVAGLCGEGEPGTLRIVQEDVYSFLARGNGRRYNLVFSDPPYDKAGGAGCMERLMRALDGDEVLEQGGLWVHEQGFREVIAEPVGWILHRNKEYGKTRILILRKA